MARRHSPPGRITTLGHFDVPGVATGRRVRIYVPDGHSRDGTRPALYLFDGQNCFTDEGSFVGGWYAHEAVERLNPGTAHVPLVVAIDHGGDRRIDELGPWRQGALGGRADPFLDWVAGSLVPQVQRELGLLPGAAGAVVGGSSMGGLAALYAHFRHPDVFGGAICMSSAFWFGGGAIIDFVRRRPDPPSSRIYLDSGAQEGRGGTARLASQVAELLRGRGHGDDRLMLRIDPRGAHNEKHWRRRLPRALRFMFRR